MSITREQFLVARPGQVLIGDDGIRRKILENRCSDRQTPCLFVESKEFGMEDVYYAPDGEISDDDFGMPITSLNHPNARIDDF